MGLTEDQYWNDFVIPYMEQMLAIEKLREMHKEKNDVQHGFGNEWTEVVNEYVAEYKQKNASKIQSFTKEVGLNN